MTIVSRGLVPAFLFLIQKFFWGLGLIDRLLALIQLSISGKLGLIQGKFKNQF